MAISPSPLIFLAYVENYSLTPVWFSCIFLFTWINKLRSRGNIFFLLFLKIQQVIYSILKIYMRVW